MRVSTFRYFSWFVVGLLLAGHAQGQQLVQVPSTFATGIQVQGEPEGMEFDDWANVPIATMDPEDNPGDFEGRPFIDIADVQVANDDDFLYLHISYYNESSVNTFIAVDTDQDAGTGFDIFALGLVGSEIGFQNDFPFQQATTIFNTNVALTGGPIGNGGALIFPFWDQDGPDKELAIPLEAMISFPAAPAFPNDSMNIMIWTDEGAGDVTDLLSYTLITTPAVAGDYNGDGAVNAADYTVWRDTLGDIGAELPADGTGDDLEGVPDGDVDQFDYDYWNANYGMGLGSAIGQFHSVPEPATYGLTGLMIALVGLSRGCWRKHCLAKEIE